MGNIKEKNNSTENGEKATSIAKVAVAGLGTVGCGLISLIEQMQVTLKDNNQTALPIKIVAVSARDKTKERSVDISAYQWFDDPVDMVKKTDANIVVELIGGEYGSAEDVLKVAIESGKSVVTANKALLARSGFEIGQLVEKHQVMIGWEAAVGGVIPIIANISGNLAADYIERIFGILNGTCNYILTNMRSNKIDFHVALEKAQQLGLAESDPTLDISGMDAAQKLALLASISFHIKPDIARMHVEGIESIKYNDIVFAESLGYRIKLIGHAERYRNKIYLNVSPLMLPLSSPLAHIEEEINAVELKSRYAGTSIVTGAGAGAHPTAVAVASDVMNLARYYGQSNYLFAVPTSNLQDGDYFRDEDYEGQYYLRIRVKDMPGVLADIMTVLKEYGVSVDMFSQRAVEKRIQPESGNVTLLMITHPIKSSVIKATLMRVEALSFVLEKLLAIRIAKG